MTVIFDLKNIHLDLNKADCGIWGNSNSRFIALSQKGNVSEIYVTDKKQDLVKVSNLLASCASNPFRPTVIFLKNYSSTVSLKKQDANGLMQEIQGLNEKIKAIRSSYSPITRFFLTLLNRIPVLIDGALFVNVADPLWAPMKGIVSGSSQILGLSPSDTLSSLPFLSICIDGFSTTSYSEDKYRFGSLIGRLSCLKDSARCLLSVVISFIGTPILAYQNSARYNWKNKFYAVTDVAVSMLLLPIMTAIVMIKYLAGAIFHPGLIYKKI